MINSSVAPWLGLDLGTTNSVAAVVNRGGKVEVLSCNYESGSYLLKSCVYYESCSDQTLVGQSDMRLSNPENVIYDAKRLMGARFNNDPQGAVRRFLDRRLPFSVVNCGGWAGFEVKHAGRTIKVLPQEVGAKILAKMRKAAEEHKDGRIEPNPNSAGVAERCRFNKAVITVPATFNQEQRLKTIEAGRMVFDEVHLITEAVAAAYAACQEHGWLKREGTKFLVYDFGGGTFDTCIMFVEGGKFHARYLDGDRELGGGDIDRKLRDHCAAEIRANYGVVCGPEGKSRGDVEKWEELLGRCELVKVRLSQLAVSSIGLDFLGIYNKRLHITRQCFEELCKPLLMQSIRIVQRMMKEAKLQAEDIDQVLLVGGSSNIPLVKNLFRVYCGFPPEKLNCLEKAAQANAEGAAIVGSQLEQAEKGNASALKLVEYTSLSLGIRTMDNIFAVIIPRNHPIPCKLSKDFYTTVNDQQSITFYVYEGERKLASENFHLGTFSIHGLSAGAAGTVKTDLSFQLNRDGILLAVATHGNDLISSLALCNMEHSSDSRKVEEAIKSAEANFAADSKEEQRQQQKYELSNAINQAKYKCSNQRVIALCSKHEAWLKANEKAACAMLKSCLEEFRRDLASIR